MTSALAEEDPGAPGPLPGSVPTPWRVLVVENDSEDAASLVRGLRRHGHEVNRVESGVAALRSFELADLLLLDLELPDLDGLEICRRVRAAGTTPIIAVTSRGSELDRVLGLQAGADDYLVKPYGFRELLARIDAVMRRVQVQRAAPAVITHGGLRVDAASRQVTLDGRRVEVTRKEFDLLHLLASQPDTVISRKRIMQQVWGDEWSRRTIDTHVSSLRHKLGSSHWIVTVRGVGFQIGRA